MGSWKKSGQPKNSTAPPTVSTNSSSWSPAMGREPVLMYVLGLKGWFGSPARPRMSEPLLETNRRAGSWASNASPNGLRRPHASRRSVLVGLLAAGSNE